MSKRLLILALALSTPAFAQSVGCGGVPGALAQTLRNGCGGVPSAPVEPTLLDGWMMNEGSGTTFLDSNTANANNAAFTSGVGTWGAVSGYPGSAFTFNGTGGAIGENQNLTNFERTTPFSVAAWFTPTSTVAESNLVSTLDIANNFIGWELSMSAVGSGNGGLEFFLINTYPANAIDVNIPAGGSAIVAGTKYFVVATYDGSSKAAGVKLYINGVLQAPTVAVNTLTATTKNTKPVSLGSRPDGSIPLNGTEADAGVYSGAITQAQISALYAAGPQ